MGRRELRERIFTLLFRVEFNKKEDMPEQMQMFFEELPELKAKDQRYIQEKYERIQEKLSEIDMLVGNAAKGWTLSRMGKVDLTLLRLAVFEMKFDDDVPVSVAINEAVELAKKFGQDESSAFINGVLAKLTETDPEK